ncbi:TetR/AcrR family transcriptional regulator [Altererythrobacter arenosus]|uniref:TetR/AcrR family transcriptional regulator n=1 Tax=Altererythrobacter arenosus TaxID=3032592 RepID=A0ABY8FT58_9SPHN|nr:TetR/AcrR family transcriptional regulator [Altererythrobacter sp. CAU 1644]WFL76606.1 TetR/AcrR family transcriptional regulator [Altererythrobacter sp. CAU 1644]
MSRSEDTRRKWLMPMAMHVMEHGMGAASLRPLAKAAGTSDRMLIYHFGNKDALIAELLSFIAESYSVMLDQAFGKDRASSRDQCLNLLLDRIRDPQMQPFMGLWWEIVAGAARGNQSYRDAAGAIMDRLLLWLESKLPVDDPDPAAGARLMLVLVEGSLMLEGIGKGDVAKAGLSAAQL